ncbi:MAG TPA: response regulator transcription factor [Limnochordales bacterium]|mgnify:CR=1 FL=1
MPCGGDAPPACGLATGWAVYALSDSQRHTPLRYTERGQPTGREAATAARILVIDDDPKLLDMVRRALVYEGFDVQTATSGAQGLQMAQDAVPDVLILDWMIPDLDGLAICRRVRESADVPILMLTARDAVEDRVTGLEAGADDYLVKPFALEELVARIRALLRRHRHEAAAMQPNEVLRHGDLVLDSAAREVRRAGQLITLSTTEFELLRLFMLNPRRVLPRELIMERVWGYDFDGESNVLEVYVGYLRRKLEQGGRSRLIHTVRGVGYVLREDAES